MAVADAATKASPPPPPARNVLAVLVFVRFVLAPMLGLVRVVCVAARALPYLFFATSWVISAGTAATIVAHRICREGSAPLVFLDAFTHAAFKLSICIIFLFLALAAVLLCVLCLVCLVAVASGSGSEVKKSAFGEITRERESTQGLFKFPRAVVLGWVADLAFILLIVAGYLVMKMSSPLKGSTSQGEMIGSVIVDLGVFGLHAIACFVIIPALALDIWRKDQTERKSGLTVADC